MAAAKKKKEQTQAIAAVCSQVALLPGAKKQGKVWIGLTWRYWDDAIDPLDNLRASLKPTLDGLVKAQILKDDSSKIVQFPIFEVREKSRAHTVTIHIFESLEEYQQWIVGNLGIIA